MSKGAAQRYSRISVQRAYKYARRTRAIKARFTYVILRNVTQPCPDSLSVAIARNETDEPRSFAIVHGFEKKKKKEKTRTEICITLINYQLFSCRDSGLQTERGREREKKKGRV